MPQLYNMTWASHLNNMMKMFTQFLVSENFCDVTLACKDMNLKAHKIVLSAGSSFFQSLLSENPCEHPIVVLKDMPYLELKAVIDFMYGGQVIVSENQLHELKRIADVLEVTGFKEAVVEKYPPVGDRQSPSKKSRRRKRRHPTSAASDNIVNGASESKRSEPDVEVVHVIHNDSPSSPTENIGEPSNLQDQTTENIQMQSSRSSESIQNNGNQLTDFLSDRDIPEGVEPVESPIANHRVDDNHMNKRLLDIIVLSDSDSDIVFSPSSTPLRKQPSKQDTAKDILPEEEFGVKPDKLIEKILTTDPTPMLLEDQKITEDQPAKQCPDMKSLLPHESGIESSKIEEKNLTTNDIPMPLEGRQTPKEDQTVKQSTGKSLVPYEIESSKIEVNLTTGDTPMPLEDQQAKRSIETMSLVPYEFEIEPSEIEEKNFSNDVSTSCVGQSGKDIADQPLECSSDTVPIDVVQSSTENFCLKGLSVVRNNGKSFAIANQRSECSPDDVYDAHDHLAPDTNAKDDLPPAKRRKKAPENVSSDDESNGQKKNHIRSNESDEEKYVAVEKHMSDESDEEDSVAKR